MVGYLNDNDINKIFNKWYQLFIKKRHTISDQDRKYWKYIKTLGLSNFKNESWKYTSLKEFLKYNFVSTTENAKLKKSQYIRLILPIDSYRLVFINGRYSASLSDHTIDPWILKINNNPNRELDTIPKPIQPDIFLHLTECLSDTTVHIILPSGKSTHKPLYLLYIDDGENITNTLTTSHYHHYFEIEHDTNSSIIEHFVSINEHNRHFNGVRTFTTVGNRSQLHHVKLIFENRYSYHTSHHDINIGHSTKVDNNIFVILGPKFIYHQTNAKLNHQDSSLSLNSLVLLDDTDIGDIRTYLEHNNKNYALSKQLHKIIACNFSTGTFNGLIKVNPGSMKTNGNMVNNNLLLHRSATINTIPKLEIYSDNVQCSHGATIGQINIDHLFYLITRGIPEKDALKMLVYAFVIEVTEIIQNTLLKNVVLTKIDQALTRSLYDNISYRTN